MTVPRIISAYVARWIERFLHNFEHNTCINFQGAFSKQRNNVAISGPLDHGVFALTGKVISRQRILNTGKQTFSFLFQIYLSLKEMLHWGTPAYDRRLSFDCIPKWLHEISLYELHLTSRNVLPAQFSSKFLVLGCSAFRRHSEGDLEQHNGNRLSDFVLL